MQVLPDESRASRSGAHPRASPSGAVRSRGARGDRPRDGAPQWVEPWSADGVHAPEGSSPGCGRARAQDTTGVRERGRSLEEERGNVGEPAVSLSHTRKGGPGDHKPWRGRGASTLATSPVESPQTLEAGKVSGRRAIREAPERDRGQSSRRRVPSKVGKGGPSDPREGRRRRAAHPLAGHRGETESSRTLTTTRQWTAQG